MILVTNIIGLCQFPFLAPLPCSSISLLRGGRAIAIAGVALISALDRL